MSSWNSPGQVHHRGSTHYWGWAVVVTLAVLLWLPRLSGPIDVRWDGAVYYLLGTSLAEGHGYRIPSEPGSPEAVQYPPLLPAFVAAHQRLSGTTNPADIAPRLRISYALMFVGYGCLIFALAKQYFTPLLAVVVTALCLLHHLTIFLSDLLFAELPFALISVAFAVVAISAASNRSWLSEIVAFALAAAGFLLKTTGVALFVAWVGDALFRREWKLGVVRSGLVLLPLLAWQLHVNRVVASTDYRNPAYEYQRAAYQYSNVTYASNILLFNPFRPELGKLDATAFGKRLASNLPWLVMAVGETLSASADTWPMRRLQARVLRRRLNLRDENDVTPAVAAGGDNQRSFTATYVLFGLPLLGLVVITAVGLRVLVRQRAWLLFLIITTTLLLVWLTPWPVQFSRYLMPSMPFLVISAVLGFMSSYRSLAKFRRLKVIGYPILWMLVLVCAVTHVSVPIKLFRERAAPFGVFRARGIGQAPRFFAHYRSWQEWEEAAAWIGTNTSDGTIVATSAPHLLYLLTNRRAVLPPMEADPKRERQLLKDVPVSYVIVDRLQALDVTRRYVQPAMEEGTGWDLAYGIDATRIYENAGEPGGDLR